MRYFYIDSLKAAWMAKEFDVRILVTNWKWEYDNGQDPYLFTKDVTEISNSETNILELHPDSIKLLKPKEGDLLRYKYEGKDELFLGTSMYSIENDDEQVELLGGNIIEQSEVSEIIQRNGKAFFMPILKE